MKVIVTYQTIPIAICSENIQFSSKLASVQSSFVLIKMLNLKQKKHNIKQSNKYLCYLWHSNYRAMSTVILVAISQVRWNHSKQFQPTSETPASMLSIFLPQEPALDSPERAKLPQKLRRKHPDLKPSVWFHWSLDSQRQLRELLQGSPTSRWNLQADTSPALLRSQPCSSSHWPCITSPALSTWNFQCFCPEDAGMGVVAGPPLALKKKKSWDNLSKQYR